jgi:hypothetical protein
LIEATTTHTVHRAIYLTGDSLPVTSIKDFHIMRADVMIRPAYAERVSERQNMSTKGL